MRAPLTGLLLAAAVASAGGAVAAGSASAPGTLVAMPRFVPEAGPLLAGDRLAWVTRRDDAVLDLWVSHPLRRVQRFAGSDAERLGSPRLSVSPGAVGLDVFETRAGRLVRSRSYRGPFGEPLHLVASCSGTRALVAPSSPDDAGPPSCVRATAPPPEPRGDVPPAALRLGGDRELLRHVDVSDARAVWVARGCANAEIRTIALPAPATVRQAAPACELRLRRRARLRGDRLRLGISCAGFSIDCAARVTVRLRGRVIARGTARYTHSTPPYAAASLRIGAVGMRLLGEGRSARLRISARIGEAALLAEPGLGGSAVRHTTQTVTQAQPPAALR